MRNSLSVFVPAILLGLLATTTTSASTLVPSSRSEYAARVSQQFQGSLYQLVDTWPSWIWIILGGALTVSILGCLLPDELQQSQNRKNDNPGDCRSVPVERRNAQPSSRVPSTPIRLKGRAVETKIEKNGCFQVGRAPRWSSRSQSLQ